MRIDARQLPLHLVGGWFVWHCEQCKEVPHVVWVDDELNQYGQHEHTNVFLSENILTIQARKIIINVQARSIMINPVEDSDNSRIEERKLEAVK